MSVKGTMKRKKSLSLKGPSLSYYVRDFIRVAISRKETDGDLKVRHPSCAVELKNVCYVCTCLTQLCTCLTQLCLLAVC
jgi:hypothetical protein